MVIPIGAPSDTVEIGLAVFGFGAVIGLLALLKNELGNFNIRPDIKEDCTLITTGIYAYIRHPMYTSVLIMMGAIVIMYPVKALFVLYSVLIVVLLIKMFYEESLWKCKSEEYINYTQSTKRVIPFIF